jgi:hypothetical protein
MVNSPIFFEFSTYYYELSTKGKYSDKPYAIWEDIGYY